MSLSRILFVSALVLVSPSTSPANRAHEVSSASSSLSARRKEDEPSATLYNGTLSNYLQVPKIFSDRSSCSSTLVSNNVLLTAAHCFAGSVAKLSMSLVNGVTRTLTCTKNPGALRFPPNGGSMSMDAIRNDVAACVLDRPVNDVPTACVGRPSPGLSRALHIGYGRTNQSGNSVYDGNQREGTARIIQQAGGVVGTYSPDLAHGPDAALGGGDSGGFTGTKDRDGKLWISAVNSASSAEIRNPNGSVLLRPEGTSYATDLESATSQTFLKSWAQEQGVKICGVTDTESPTPPQPPTPPEENPREKYKLGLGLLNRPAAAEVQAVVPDSVAAKQLDLKSGDRILSLNGDAIGDEKTLRDAAKRFLDGDGDTASFEVLRADGKRETVSYTLSNEDRAKRKEFRFGIYPEDGKASVQIASVLDDRDAKKLGILPGELLTHVDGEPVGTAKETAENLRAKILDKSRSSIRLTVSPVRGPAREVVFRLP